MADGKSAALALLSIGLLLVFALIGINDSLRGDDVWSLRTAAKTFPEMMAELRADVHPPLYYLLLHPWIRLAGASEPALRALSAIFYVLSAFAVYWAARGLLSPYSALTAAIVYYTSLLAGLCGQLVRMYSLLALLGALSIGLLIRLALSQRPRAAPLAAWIVVSVLGTFTHIWFFFLLFAELTAVALFHRDKLLRLTGATAVACAPYSLLWLPVMLRQLKQSAEAAAWLARPTLSDIGQTLFLQGGMGWLLAVILAIALYKRRAQGVRWRVVRFLAAMYGVAMLLPLAISFVKPVFYSRFTVVALPLLAMLLAALFEPLAEWKLPAVALAVTAPAIWFLATQTGGCDSRSVASHLLREARPGSIVIYGSLSRLPVDYYLQRAGGLEGVFQTSFPAAIDRHPGYEGRTWDPARRPALEREADALLEEIRRRLESHSTLRVVVLDGVRPEVDAVLRSRLESLLERAPSLDKPCPFSQAHFTQVTVYEGSRPRK